MQEKLEMRDDFIHKLSQEVLVQSTTISSKISNLIARRYLEWGYTIRLHCLRESRYQLYNLFEQDGGTYKHDSTLYTMHVNTIYIHMFGALDNLAWALHYEFDLVEGVTEFKNRKKIGLFTSELLKALELKNKELVKKINNYKTWYEESKEFRDPSAHRLPLYCPPAILTDKDILKKQELLKKLENINIDDSDYMQMFREAQTQGVFKSWFCLNTEENIQFYSLIRVVFDDYEQFLKLSHLVFNWIKTAKHTSV